MTTVVRAPGNLIVATIDDINVRLAGVEVAKAPLFVDIPSGTRCVVVYLSAAKGHETNRHDSEMAQDEDFQARMAGDGTDRPLKLSNLQRVGITITDDVGGSYEPAGFRMEGDGDGWEDMRVHSPAPTATATILHLDFTVDGQSTGRSCDVALTIG